MISSVSGTIEYKGGNFVVVENSGIGYKVLLPESFARDFSGEVKFFTHEIVRDSERELFGFRSIEALELFSKLIAISGVGPRIAQKIVFSGSVDQIKSQIMSGNLSFLTDMPGVGTKTAQKIILELKGALAEEPAVSSEDQETLDALVSLGYQQKDAQKAISSLSDEFVKTEERVRAALKCLSQSNV